MAFLELIIPSKYDNYQLSLSIFQTLKPKGVIQIIHGMEEHKARYNDFAYQLTKSGYIVVISDLRAHGCNVDIDKLGYFDKKNGHIALIEDQITILDFIKKEFPNLEINLLGHSMGSIIARNLLQTKDKEYKKVILCGAPNYQSTAYVGLYIAKIICFFRGKKKSHFLRKLAMGSFNKKIKNPQNNVEWLSESNENKTQYISDPYCGFGFTNEAFKDLFQLVINMQKEINKRNKELQILIIYGENDPVTGFEKGIKSTVDTLNKFNYFLIKKKVYKNKRHEILRDNDNQLVINDIINFLD